VRAGAAREGAVALVIGTSDLVAAAGALGTLAVAHEDAASVPATAANGVIVSFVARRKRRARPCHQVGRLLSPSSVK
jgi:hypothetical protein